MGICYPSAILANLFRYVRVVLGEKTITHGSGYPDSEYGTGQGIKRGDE